MKNSALMTAAAALFLAACGPNHVGGDPVGASGSDVRWLATTLRQAHPNLYFHETQLSLNEEFARVAATLAAAPSPAETFRLLAPIAASIGDAHTSIGPYTRDYMQFRDRRGLLFPLELRFENNRGTIVANYQGGPALPRGSVVSAINGKPIRSLLHTLGTYVSGDSPTLKAWQISQDLRALMWLHGEHAPFGVTLLTPQGKKVTARLRGCTIDAIHAWDRSSAGIQQLSPFSLQIKRTERIAILTIHSFDVSEADDFHRFVADMPSKLRGAAVESLIIDIRQNTGGITDLSDELLEAFAKRRFRDFSEVDTKVSDVTKNAYGHEQYVAIYGEAAWLSDDGTILKQAGGYVEPLPPARVFPGNVYILVGSGTYSTAAIFAAAAQDSGNARILGTESGGYPTLYGEIYSFTLPASGLHVTVSTKYFVRSNGDKQPQGVIPDKVFAETALGAQDIELEQAIGYVSKRAKSKASGYRSVRRAVN